MFDGSIWASCVKNMTVDNLRCAAPKEMLISIHIPCVHLRLTLTLHLPILASRSNQQPRWGTNENEGIRNRLVGERMLNAGFQWCQPRSVGGRMNGTMQPIPGDCICTYPLYSLFLYSMYPCISRSLLFCVPRYSAVLVIATIMSRRSLAFQHSGCVLRWRWRRCGQMLHVLMGCTCTCDLKELICDLFQWYSSFGA